MTRRKPEEPHDASREDDAGFTRAAGVVAAAVLVVLALLTVVGIALAATAAAGAASVIARWTGLSAGHVLTGILVFAALLMMIWQVGRLIEEIRLARGDVWQIIEQRERELEELEELLEPAAEDRAVHLRPVRAESSRTRAETTARKRGHRERTP
jgi:ABC-type multidrug transport system fused ATPase/permease subunit